MNSWVKCQHEVMRAAACIDTSNVVEKIQEGVSCRKQVSEGVKRRGQREKEKQGEKGKCNCLRAVVGKEKGVRAKETRVKEREGLFDGQGTDKKLG